MWTAKTDQPGLMPGLPWVFAGHMGHFVGFVLLRLKSSFIIIIIISETMVLTHQKDVEAAKSAKLILTGLLGAALFSLFRVE